MPTFVKATQVYQQGQRTLPGRYYTSAEIYAEEQERIFTERWICAGRAAEIPEAGDYVLRRIAGECDRGPWSRRRAPGVLQRVPPPRHAAMRRAAGALLRDDPVPLSRVDLHHRRATDRRATHERGPRLRQGRLPAPGGAARDVGGLRLRQPGAGAAGFRTGVRAARRAVQPLQPADPQVCAPDRLRRRGKLEARLPKLFRVPALPRHSPRTRQAHAVHERRKRPVRRAVPGRLHGHYEGRREPDAERARLWGAGRRAAGGGPAPCLLLFALPEPAPVAAPRLRDVPHALAGGPGPDADHLRMAVPSRLLRASGVRP